jgi:hypothetical protein
MVSSFTGNGELLGLLLCGPSIAGPCLIGSQWCQGRRQNMLVGDWIWFVAGPLAAIPWLANRSDVTEEVVYVIICLNTPLLLGCIVGGVFGRREVRGSIGWTHWAGALVVGGECLAEAVWSLGMILAIGV